MTIPDQAIQAACEAYKHPNRMVTNTSDGRHRDCMEAALEAALPHLEAALRTQIAAEDNSGRPDAIDPDWREKIAIALQERKAARQQKGTTK